MRYAPDRRHRSTNRRAALSFFRPLVVEALEERALLAITPQLVADINSTLRTVVHPSGPIVDVGGVAYFAADVDTGGVELWKSDGTAAGTLLVKEINTGGSSDPVYLTNVNGTLFFSVDDGVNGRELWRSDGTFGGTTLVKNIFAGLGNSTPRALANVNGTLFFSANDGVNGRELWRSDGTNSGTTLVKDIRAGGESYPRLLTNVNGTLFFQANDGTNGVELWKSDGTSSGTTLVKDINAAGGSGPQYLTNVNGTLFFQADDGTSGDELWKSDGTSGGTTLVKDISVGGGSTPFYFTNVNGTCFFSADDGVNGRELWQSDGTDSGTALVKDINAGGSSSPQHLTNVNGALFFGANDGTSGVELWKSDGTSDGTTLVKDINEGGSSSPYALANMNGTLFFGANDGTSGHELWTSDGTSGGTTLIKDVNASGASLPGSLTNLQGTLFFSANDGVHGRELWTSDGTPAGTSSLSRRTRSSSPIQFAVAGASVFFSANDGTSGYELWKTDGTTAGTQLVKDIRAGGSSSFPFYTANVNGVLFFNADDGNHGYELWKSDGTAAGTTLVKDINADGDSFPFDLVNVNGLLFFSADDGVKGVELWKSDGTAAGTVLVKDINAGGSSTSHYLTNVNGTLFFSATDGAGGYELWKSDGTPGGTMLVKEINANGDSDPKGLTNVNGTLFFQANDGVNGADLWKSDGTSAGTMPVKNIRPSGDDNPAHLANVNGTLFFQANDGVNGVELWKSDGTTNGTTLVKDIRPGGSGSPRYLTNINGNLFFSANDGVTGYELWKSDGTAVGTTLVKDINAGFGGGVPYDLTNVNGTLFFSANDGAIGHELWKSDGTAAGTVLIHDIAPGPTASSPSYLTYLNGRLMFAAFEFAHETELWSMLICDFGDAAASFGTRFADNGAAHIAVGPQLGLLRDDELDAAASAAATGDDFSGLDDEDGLVVSPVLLRGANSSVTVDVVTGGESAKLDAWIDFDQDGTFGASEKIINSQTVSAGQSSISFSVPATAKLGPATARFRISTAGGLGPTGLAQDGEVEDYVLTIAQDFAVNLATGNGADKISIRKNDNLVEIFDVNTSTVITSSPLAFTNSVVVNGSVSEADEIAVDYAFGGFFSLTGGIVLDGGASQGDLVRLTGTPATLVQYVSRGLSLGNATLRTQEGPLENSIQFTNFEPVTVTGVSTFEVEGALDVADQLLTVFASSPVKLGTLTTIAGGSIQANGSISLATGQTLRGVGTVSGNFAADIGSLIHATGNASIFLTLGDVGSPAGFITRGELRADGGKVVTLEDSNQAVLGSLTVLGSGGVAAVLGAPKGLVIDFGNNLVGFGNVITPNSVLTPVINNGAIKGDFSAAITLAGYVKGVGSLDNVTITGTNSPGFSPATVYYGSASYGTTGKLVAELGGTSGGAYDRQIYTGAADLAGTLDIELIGSYQPEVADTFTLITAAGGVHGTFSTQTLPSLPELWSWQLAYGANDLKTTIVTSRPWHNSRKGLDVTNDGHIAPEDPLEVINYINAFGSQGLPARGTCVAPFIDVNGDNFVAPDDALDVINAINAGLGGEGESFAKESNAPASGLNNLHRAAATHDDWTDLIALLALDMAQQNARRRYSLR